MGGGVTVSDDGADEGPGGGLRGEVEEADPRRGCGSGERARVPRHREAREDGVRAGAPPRLLLLRRLVGGVGVGGERGGARGRGDGAAAAAAGVCGCVRVCACVRVRSRSY